MLVSTVSLAVVQWLVATTQVSATAANPHCRHFLPNGSALHRPLPQVLEPQKHGQHPFELAVEVDLVAAEPFQLVGVECLAESLFADQRTVGEFLSPGLVPG